MGVSTSLSHSSYNSANEELEFDLYDYRQRGSGDWSVIPHSNNHLGINKRVMEAVIVVVILALDKSQFLGKCNLVFQVQHVFKRVGPEQDFLRQRAG